MVNERVIAEWGSGQPTVRAIALTSSRAIPGTPVDRLSDWDVVLVVDDVEPWVVHRDWIADFGVVLVAYWDPVFSDEETSIPVGGNIVQYAGNLKMDFSIWPAEMMPALAMRDRLPAELDAGYRVVLDNDRLFQQLPAPTGRGYVAQRPSEDAYLHLVSGFFIGVPYVAKMLLRDELLPAKWCLDYDMRYVYLVPMLEWRTAIDQSWSIAPGVNGRRLRERLPAEIWTLLGETYAGLDPDDTWRAMFAMIDLFGLVAAEVGQALGYSYPADLHQSVTDHARRMRADGV